MRMIKINMQVRILIVALSIIFHSQSHTQQFVQQGNKLVGTGAIGIAQQGIAVAISGDGNTAVVGGSKDNANMGAVWIFTRTAGVWSQQGNKLVGTNSIGTGVLQGAAVAISSDGNTVIVGGPGDNALTGAVWIFSRESLGEWHQKGEKLVGTGAVGNAHQGISVALSGDGNTALVGGFSDNSNTGAAWVFTSDTNGVWSQQGQKLVATDAIGNPRLGISVALSSDGNTALVGGWWDNAQAGAAWVFTRSGNVWNQQGSKLVGTGVIGNNTFQGNSVSLSSDGNTAIVAGYNDDASKGAVWVFTRNSGVWTQQGDKLVGTGAVGPGRQGQAVSVSSDGNTLLISAVYDNGQVGAGWVFSRNGGVWTQLGTKLVGTGAVGNAQQGQSAALSDDGNTAILGGFADNSFMGAGWIFTHGTTNVNELLNTPPSSITLKQNYPNPFNPSTNIQYEVNSRQFVSLKVYDVLGKEIASLVNEEKPAGSYEVNFDASRLSSGVYFYKLQAGSFVETKKMVITK